MLCNPEQPASIIPFEQDQSNSIRCVKFENSPMKTNTIIKQQPHPSHNLITATASAYAMRLEIRGNTQLRIRNSKKKKKENVKSSITWRNFASTIFIQRFGNTISGGGGSIVARQMLAVRGTWLEKHDRKMSNWKKN